MTKQKNKSKGSDQSSVKDKSTNLSLSTNLAGSRETNINNDSEPNSSNNGMTDLSTEKKASKEKGNNDNLWLMSLTKEIVGLLITSSGIFAVQMWYFGRLYHSGYISFLNLSSLKASFPSVPDNDYLMFGFGTLILALPLLLTSLLFITGAVAAGNILSYKLQNEGEDTPEKDKKVNWGKKIIFAILLFIIGGIIWFFLFSPFYLTIQKFISSQNDGDLLWIALSAIWLIFGLSTVFLGGLRSKGMSTNKILFFITLTLIITLFLTIYLIEYGQHAYNTGYSGACSYLKEQTMQVRFLSKSPDLVMAYQPQCLLIGDTPEYLYSGFHLLDTNTEKLFIANDQQVPCQSFPKPFESNCYDPFHQCPAPTPFVVISSSHSVYPIREADLSNYEIAPRQATLQPVTYAACPVLTATPSITLTTTPSPTATPQP